MSMHFKRSLIPHSILSSIQTILCPACTELSKQLDLPRDPRKKALLIGINYPNLKGPQKDVESVKKLLIECFGYLEENIVVLTDKPGTSKELFPTKANIMRELQSFVQRALPGDDFFFLFAGHSIQRPSEDPPSTNGCNIEEDGQDEYIIPYDAFKRGLKRKDQLGDESIRDELMIRDDDLRKHLVEPLVPGSKLVAIFDSCHSATLLDLDHHRCNRVARRTSSARRVARRILEPIGKYISNRNPLSHEIAFSSFFNSPIFKGFSCTGLCPRVQPRNTPFVLCISACKDSQTSMETPDGNSLTSMIVELLRENPAPKLKQLMRVASSKFQDQEKKMFLAIQEYKRECERSGTKANLLYPISTQDPQLSSLWPLKMKSTFVL